MRSCCPFIFCSCSIKRFQFSEEPGEDYSQQQSLTSTADHRTNQDTPSAQSDGAPNDRRQALSLGESSRPYEATAHHTTKPSGECTEIAKEDPVRASHFANTLARMEGRIPPSSSSPIKRYVHPERHYSDKVDLEHSSPTLRCPKPLRWSNHVRMSRLFQVGIVGGSDELELHESAMPNEPSKRHMNLTPNRVSSHNDETAPGEKRYESAAENTSDDLADGLINRKKD